MATITKEALDQRLKDLRDQKDQALQNVQAIHGAILDVQYWLQVLSQEEEVETEAEQGS